jgi:hypothetical protein
MADASVPTPGRIRTSVFAWPPVAVMSGCELVSVLMFPEGAGPVDVVVVVVVDEGPVVWDDCDAGACPGDCCPGC